MQGSCHLEQFQSVQEHRSFSARGIFVVVPIYSSPISAFLCTCIDCGTGKLLGHVYVLCMCMFYADHSASLGQRPKRIIGVGTVLIPYFGVAITKGGGYFTRDIPEGKWVPNLLAPAKPPTKKAKPPPKSAAQSIRVESGEHVQEFKVKWSRTKKFYNEPVKE